MPDAAWIRSAVEELEGPLTRYAVSITGDPERARDIVQESFLRLCREERSRVDGHVKEWLFTVCRNHWLDVCRKESRMTTTSEPGVGLASHDPDPARVSEGRDSVSRVLALLDTIPEKQREVIRLKFQGGLSYREIARVTELTVGYVGWLIHTGLKTLREKLDAASQVAPGA